MFHMMNIRRDTIKKNIEMITEIIIIIKKGKDILLIIINMIDMKNMIQSMKDEVEVDIVWKDIIVIAKENIVEIVIVVVEELEVEINIAFFTENQLPDLNAADYAIGYGHINHLDRYFTFPYIVNILSLKNRTSKDFKIVRDKVLSSKKRKKFCAAVVNMPLNYNLKKKQIKKYILAQMVEKGVVSSKLYYDELEKKIEDIELNKDTNIVLLTMENLELAKSMILLDGIILLGHTIRVSLYSEVKDLSMDNLQKASALLKVPQYLSLRLKVYLEVM